MGNWKDTIKRLTDEANRRGLYDAISDRIDTITENARGLSTRYYNAIQTAASEILIMVSHGEEKKQ